MRWRRTRRGTAVADAVESPVILAVTSPLTRQTAQELASTLERLRPDAEVVIDLTGIPSFDTDGAEELMHLQESASQQRLSIVGLRQATARLVGDAGSGPDSSPDIPVPGWVIRRLRNLVVVQAPEDAGGASTMANPGMVNPRMGKPSTDTLEPALTAAGETDAAIVVVDLRGIDVLTREGLHAITFASSTAALRGQEMLVVNVSPQAADVLRTAGLSATTFVAPEPPLDTLPGTRP